MNIYDCKRQMPVMAEIYRRRMAAEERNEKKKKELRSITSSENVINLIIEIEELGGIVDLETGDVFWHK